MKRPKQSALDFFKKLEYLDECTGITEEMYKAAFPKIDGIDGKQVIITSTPAGENHFYDLYKKSFKN